MDYIEIQKNTHENRFNFTTLDNEILFDKNLNTTQKVLLWFFNVVSINKEYSYYSIKNISKLIDISESTIIRNMPRLLELNYIEKKQEVLPNGFKHNYYFLKEIKKTTLKELINQSIHYQNDSYTLSKRQSIHYQNDSYTLSKRQSIHYQNDRQRNTNIINTNKNNKNDNIETIGIIQDNNLSNKLSPLSLKDKDNKITKSYNIKAKDNIDNLKLPFGNCEFDEATNSYKHTDIQKENSVNLIKNAIITNNIDVLDSNTFKAIDDINMFNKEFENNKQSYPIYLNKMLEVHIYDYETVFKILEHFIKYDFIDLSFYSFCSIILVLSNKLINTNLKSIFELCKGKDKVEIIENLFNQFLVNRIDTIDFIYEYKKFIENNFLDWYQKQSIHTKKTSIVKQLINQMECYINE